jgi:hypothetical protein
MGHVLRCLIKFLFPFPPLPQRFRLRISPQPFLPLSCFRLKTFQHRISRRILPIPPAPAMLDEFLIQVHAIGQEHVSNGASVNNLSGPHQFPQ